MYRTARHEAWQDVNGPAVPFDGDAFQRDALRCWKRAPERAVMCAMQRDETAGLLQMDLDRGAAEGVGYIPFLYMDPAHRRQGLGCSSWARRYPPTGLWGGTACGCAARRTTGLPSASTRSTALSRWERSRVPAARWMFWKNTLDLKPRNHEEPMNQFLTVTKADLAERGWEEFDFLVITGDAYVDHPSFGPAIISRVLEAEGYRVAILAQPDWRKASSFTALGRPRLGVLLSSGNIDSMVAHYTVAKKRRHDDAYSPGNRAGLRPDRAVIVYANKVREAFGDIPLVIGGLEASLRRFAHYDYWEDKVRRAILFDSQADLLVYGMGERATREIAARLASGTPIREITDVKGTAFIAKDPSVCAYPKVECPSFEAVSTDKRAYAQANQIQYEEHDPVRGKAILQRHGDRLLVVNPPAMPLTTAELDFVAELPYVREPHPMYDEMGACPPSRRCASPWPTTGAASGRATSAPWPSTRGGSSPPAAMRASCGRWRP